MRIAKGGLSWIITSIFVNIILLILSLFIDKIFQYFSYFLLVLSLLITIILIVFFRDPERKIGKHIVAVADGKIREISNESDKEIGECTKISTFMNIHNVHVNRMPVDGKIKDILHYNGKHTPAFKKESENNERVKLVIETNKEKIKIVQIAGTLARRIVPYVKKDDKLNKGDKIGIIRLGSRVDVFIPIKFIKSVNVKINDRVKAGEDTIAEIHD